jgi:hypothetical protein
MAIIEISEIEDHETFRNELASIAHDGRRKWIYARKPSGKFTQYRTYLSYVLLAFLFFAPYLKINNHQFMLFNIIERKFVIFGIPFWTQDFYLALLLILFYWSHSLFTLRYLVEFGVVGSARKQYLWK